MIGVSNMSFTFGSVYKDKSSWWFTTQTDSSDLQLSSKFKNKKLALAHGQKELFNGRIDNLNIYMANGSLDWNEAIYRRKS
tara:strand:+ start:218 stop:460 length:243 start_codon:yes stop_codon:yes gene_type:complete